MNQTQACELTAQRAAVYKTLVSLPHSASTELQEIVTRRTPGILRVALSTEQKPLSITCLK